MFAKLKSLNLTSIYYTLFEGLSRGGNQLLLIFVASFLSKTLYFNLMLLVSLESLLTMFFLSYYVDVLYSYKEHRVKSLFSAFIDFSFLQLLLFISLFYLFRSDISTFYNYDLTLLILPILGNGFISNVLSNISVAAQIQLNHKKALLYKSLPFFFSFIICLVFFILLEDKIFAFFFGRFLGLFLFFIFIIFNDKLISTLFKFNLRVFLSLFKRIKYSFIIAMISWLFGLGFLNFAKLYTTDKDSLALLAMMISLFAVLQLLANGVNQVYVPNLKKYMSNSVTAAFNYSKRVSKDYVKIGVFLACIIGVIYLVKGLLISIFPSLQPLIFESLLFVIILFFVNIFQWIATPFFMISNKYKTLFWLKFNFALISIFCVGFLFFVFNLDNFIFYYLLVQTVNCLGVFIYFKAKFYV